MQVKNCEKLEHSQVRLTIEVEQTEFEAALEKAYKKSRRKLRVKGFRPGKAPRKVIERVYGVEVFYEDAINDTYPNAYEAAVKEQDLRVVSYPEVEMEGECSPTGYAFTATVTVYPEVTLGQYKGLSAPRGEAHVEDSDVEEQIQELVERNTRLVPVERGAQNGDTVIIDFEGFLDGKAFEGGKDENHSLELGSGSFIPGFEEQLVGIQAEEERRITVTFPEDYSAEQLAGKEAEFQVKCREVKEKDVPELDDDFAMDVSEFDTLEELRADLRKTLEKEAEDKVQGDFEDKLMEQVADNLTCEVPDVMVENQMTQFVNDLANRAASYGIEFATYLQMMGKTEAQIREESREPALKQVRVSLGVDAVIKAENITVSEEEIEAEYTQMADDYNMAVEAVKKYVNQEEVEARLKARKAVKVVSDSATALPLEEEKPEEESADDADAPAAETAEEAATETVSDPA